MSRNASVIFFALFSSTLAVLGGVLIILFVPVRLLYVRDVLGDEMFAPGRDRDG